MRGACASWRRALSSSRLSPAGTIGSATQYQHEPDSSPSDVLAVSEDARGLTIRRSRRNASR